MDQKREDRDLGFAIVEKMGHSVGAGHLWEVELCGDRVLRLEHARDPSCVQIIPLRGVVYTVTLCTEEDAKAARTVHPLEALRILPRKPCRPLRGSECCYERDFLDCNANTCAEFSAADLDIPF